MEEKTHIATASLGTTAATLCTAGVSFLSQIVIARLFGASAELDAYLTAGALPLTLTGVLMAAVGYVLIPILTECREDDATLRRTTGNFLVLLAAAAVSIALFGSLFARGVARWAAPGLRAEKLALAEALQPYFWAATGIILFNSFLASLHQFHRRFVLAAFSGLLIPFSIVLAGLSLAPRLGILSIALGNVAGSVLQTGLLFAGLRERARLAWTGLGEAARRFLRPILPVTGSLLPFTLLPVIDAYWTARLPDGSLSYLAYATRIVIAVTSITVQGVAVVIFPFLADDASRGALEQLRHRLSDAWKFLLAVQIPLLIFLTVLRIPLLSLLFERGNFDRQATLKLAAVLPWFLMGMIGMASMNLIVRGFYAVLRPITPAVLGLGCLVLYAVLSGALSSVFSYVGIGMAYAVYWTVLCVAAGTLLGKRIGGFWKKEDVTFIGKVVMAAAVAGLAILVVLHLLPSSSGGVGQVVILGLLGGGSFTGVAYTVFSPHEIRLITSVVRPGQTR